MLEKSSLYLTKLLSSFIIRICKHYLKWVFFLIYYIHFDSVFKYLFSAEKISISAEKSY